MVFRHDFLRQRQHLVGGGGVQRGGVFVQEQQLGGDQRCHQKGQRLTLPARKQPDRLFHTILQPQPQRRKFFGKKLAVGAGNAGKCAGAVRRAQVGKRQIFLNGHMGRGAAQRVLEHTPHLLGTAVIRQKGDVLSVQRDMPGISDKFARNGIEQRGFARPVGADDGGKIARLQVQVDVIQRQLFVDGAGVKGFAYVLQLKHGGHPPCGFWRGGGSGLPCRAAPGRRSPVPR